MKLSKSWLVAHSISLKLVSGIPVISAVRTIMSDESKLPYFVWNALIFESMSIYSLSVKSAPSAVSH